MSVYELGQTITWPGILTRDAAGALADVRSPLATVTLPDGRMSPSAVA